MKKNILGVLVNSGSEDEYIRMLLNDIESDKSGYVCFTNVHMLIEAHDNQEFKKVVNKANYAFPDGFPIAKSFRFLHSIKQERIAGMDFLPRFLAVCNTHKLRVAFIGSTDKILESTQKKICKVFPLITLTQLVSPPFGKKWDNEGYVKALNESKTQVVFVALGCPKQEIWMDTHTSRINAFMFGIGGALPTYVGEIERAPGFMSRFGFEWLYRLFKEPKRLFKRYFYTNTKFIYLLVKEILK